MSEYTKTALVLGAGGFIGSHMVKHLVSEGYWVRGVDVKSPDFSETGAHEFVHGDLTERDFVRRVFPIRILSLVLRGMLILHDNLGYQVLIDYTLDTCKQN